MTALEFEKNVPVQYNGPITSLASMSYLITTVLTGYIIYLFPKRLFILLSFVGSTAGLFMMGPSMLLGLPNVFWLFMVGYIVMSGSLGFLFIPILPEMIEAFY